eukprot:1154615-Pelagomonas_calceolata.AAC.3
MITRQMCSSSSHHALCSGHGDSQRTSIANRVRQPHQLNVNQRHVYVIISSTVKTRGLDDSGGRLSGSMQTFVRTSVEKL